MMQTLLAATLRPKAEVREGRLEVFVDLVCRDKGAATRLQRKLGGRVRRGVLRAAAPNLAPFLKAIGAPVILEIAAEILDMAFRKVRHLTPDIQAKREQALTNFTEKFREWVDKAL